VSALNTRLITGLEELVADVVTPSDPARRGPLVCVRSTDAPALVASLAEERITCSLRDTNLRVATHFYNTEADIDTLLAALASRRHLLA
jgi:kynureninase